MPTQREGDWMTFETFRDSTKTTNVTSFPKCSKWRCSINGSPIITVLENQEPNWFHRWMQYVILGFDWHKE